MIGVVLLQPYSLAAKLDMAQVRGEQPKMLKLDQKNKKNKSVWSREKIKSLI